MKRGQRCRVRLHGDDRELRAIYLGPAGDAVDRPDRRMFAVDDGESWKLVMEPSVDKVRVRKRISWAEAT